MGRNRHLVDSGPYVLSYSSFSSRPRSREPDDGAVDHTTTGFAGPPLSPLLPTLADGDGGGTDDDGGGDDSNCERGFGSSRSAGARGSSDHDGSGELTCCDAGGAGGARNSDCGVW
jgi:hypothetical protein